MSNVIKQTQDGSQTLYSEQFDATYHSIFGAVEEAIHVFIAGGLDFALRTTNDEVSIFEMGFGTGLNAWLTYVTSVRRNLTINYTSIELYPLDKSIWSNLNYVQSIPCNQAEQNAFVKINDCDWNAYINISKTFRLKKLSEDIINYPFISESLDIIYFDAFAPNTQGILWEEELHIKLYNSLKPGGALVTYCAKGAFKRMLKHVGYTLDSLNGPHRKHEMTRAVKPI